MGLKNKKKVVRTFSLDEEADYILSLASVKLRIAKSELINELIYQYLSKYKEEK